MTRTTNARLAGFAFLIYIAAGIASMILFGRATSGEGIAAQLAGIAQHTGTVNVVLVLGLVMCFSALVLAVTLHAITRGQDPDLAMLALLCRAGEGVISGVSIPETQRLLWLATTTGAEAPDTGAAHALGAYLLTGDVTVTGTFFAVGSLLFCYLLWRGRMIPIAMAWLGVIASALLVVALPLELAGCLNGPIARLIWIPMLAFEVPFAVWLILKGGAMPARAHAA
jgi:hypothetical protein